MESLRKTVNPDQQKREHKKSLYLSFTFFGRLVKVSLSLSLSLCQAVGQQCPISRRQQQKLAPPPLCDRRQPPLPRLQRPLPRWEPLVFANNHGFLCYSSQHLPLSFASVPLLRFHFIVLRIPFFRLSSHCAFVFHSFHTSASYPLRLDADSL